jgi:hypothetical protein
MKKLASLFVAASLVVAGSAFKSPKGEICFKVKNDTGGSITLHTGSGTSPMNGGIQKEFCMEEGSTLYVAEKGKKGKVVVQVSADIKGKVIKLSSVL